MFTPCDTTDTPALAVLLRGLHAHHVAQVPHRFHDQATQEELQAVLDDAMAEGAQLRAYRVEGVPRGYLMWRWRLRAGSALEHPQRVALLEHIWVDPSWRRRGVARRLIAGFEAEISGQGAEGWITKVHAFNAPSRALMLGAGAMGAVEVLEKRL
ncbi:GNAT family N-acetyltransferase [Salipiger mangrovisoli]|uniref:GNAT family N-acetyltransferase n=1 Tax=Salipiger mangrovisoli TaxID=2865933 RepID=A0ABR9WVC4_9RHOB|nr:GNAT family N-acetyltransferase [Salipiger mangrovisoli]MBE9635231.1 GNAT family N-acetyltransferase [Salipiger mangrovisoli]